MFDKLNQYENLASMKPKMLEAQMLVRSHRETPDLIELVVIGILEGKKVRQ